MVYGSEVQPLKVYKQIIAHGNRVLEALLYEFKVWTVTVILSN